MHLNLLCVLRYTRHIPIHAFQSTKIQSFIMLKIFINTYFS